jgi:hypothetical protein
MNILEQFLLYTFKNIWIVPIIDSHEEVSSQKKARIIRQKSFYVVALLHSLFYYHYHFHNAIEHKILNCSPCIDI